MSRETQESRFELRKISNDRFNTEDSNERGRLNERRAFTILNRLVDDGIFIRTRLASKKQNHKGGIDMFGVVASNSDTDSPGEIMIPFQIKSSLALGFIFLDQHRQSQSRRKIIVVVVNENRPDEAIGESIRVNVDLYLRRGNKYSQSSL